MISFFIHVLRRVKYPNRFPAYRLNFSNLYTINTQCYEFNIQKEPKLEGLSKKTIFFTQCYLSVFLIYPICLNGWYAFNLFPIYLRSIVENVLWRSYACRDYRLVGFTGDICPKNARKRYNVTILELNPVVGRDDVVVDHCRRRESSTSSGGVNDGLQSSCSECTDRYVYTCKTMDTKPVVNYFPILAVERYRPNKLR
ncbi:hypothetical protein QTP88_008660 [Uroleucon formosanum]